MGEDDGRVIIGQFADATSKEPQKTNKHLSLAMQHHNEGAAHAAQAHTFFDNVVKAQFDAETDYGKALDGMSEVIWSGYFAANSHKGAFLRDFLVKEHRVYGPATNIKGSIFDRLLGKSNNNPQAPQP